MQEDEARSRDHPGVAAAGRASPARWASTSGTADRDVRSARCSKVEQRRRAAGNRRSGGCAPASHARSRRRARAVVERPGFAGSHQEALAAAHHPGAIVSFRRASARAATSRSRARGRCAARCGAGGQPREQATQRRAADRLRRSGFVHRARCVERWPVLDRQVAFRGGVTAQEDGVRRAVDADPPAVVPQNEAGSASTSAAQPFNVDHAAAGARNCRSGRLCPEPAGRVGRACRYCASRACRGPQCCCAIEQRKRAVGGRNVVVYRIRFVGLIAA